MRGQFTPMRAGDHWLAVSALSQRPAAKIVIGRRCGFGGTPIAFRTMREAEHWIHMYEEGRLASSGVGPYEASLGQPWRFFGSTIWPSVGSGRPSSMFGGLRREGTVTGRPTNPQPASQELAWVSSGKYEDWRDVEAEDGFSDLPVATLLLAWWAAIDGLTESQPNEEALLSGVPVVAFQ